MKRNVLYTMAVLLMAGTAFTACSSDDEVVNVPAEGQTWKICIPATKGIDADTRVLTLDGKKLKAEWTEGDKVFVAKGSNLDDNQLTADASGTTANLTGELAGTYSVGDELTLFYGFKINIIFVASYFDYLVGQNGSFDNMQDYDYAMATVKVETVDGGVITTTPAYFKPGQSIYHLTFKDGDGKAIVAKRVGISSANKKIITNYDPLNRRETSGSLNFFPDTPVSEFWVAMRMDESIGDDVITFQAEDEDGYIYEGTKKATATMPVNGKYYVATVTLSKTGEQNTLKITPEGSYTVSDNSYLVEKDAIATGKADKYNIRIKKDNVSLNINNVELINGTLDANRQKGIVFNLEGTNKVKYTNFYMADMTFKGTGSLTFEWLESSPLDLNSEGYTGVKLGDGLELINNNDGTCTIKPGS